MLMPLWLPLGLSMERDPDLVLWRLVLGATPRKHERVLLRGRVGTLRAFGLLALPEVELAYERAGGIQIGKWRSGGGNTNWKSVRIALNETYPNSRRPRAWSVSVSQNASTQHLVDMAHVIQAHRTDWAGLMDRNGAWLDRREWLLAQSPSGHVRSLLAA